MESFEDLFRKNPQGVRRKFKKLIRFVDLESRINNPFKSSKLITKETKSIQRSALRAMRKEDIIYPINKTINILKQKYPKGLPKTYKSATTIPKIEMAGAWYKSPYKGAQKYNTFAKRRQIISQGLKTAEGWAKSDIRAKKIKDPKVIKQVINIRKKQVKEGVRSAMKVQREFYAGVKEGLRRKKIADVGKKLPIVGSYFAKKQTAERLTAIKSYRTSLKMLRRTDLKYTPFAQTNIVREMIGLSRIAKRGQRAENIKNIITAPLKVGKLTLKGGGGKVGKVLYNSAKSKGKILVEGAKMFAKGNKRAAVVLGSSALLVGGLTGLSAGVGAISSKIAGKKPKQPLLSKAEIGRRISIGKKKSTKKYKIRKK